MQVSRVSNFFWRWLNGFFLLLAFYWRLLNWLGNQLVSDLGCNVYRKE